MIRFEKKEDEMAKKPNVEIKSKVSSGASQKEINEAFAMNKKASSAKAKKGKKGRKRII
jgi:hypothetical protein